MSDELEALREEVSDICIKKWHVDIANMGWDERIRLYKVLLLILRSMK